eukprot:COSAG02_NODE_12721_length_1503_cov_1.806268_1_plen_248_part_10
MTGLLVAHLVDCRQRPSECQILEITCAATFSADMFLHTSQPRALLLGYGNVRIVVYYERAVFAAAYTIAVADLRCLRWFYPPLAAIQPNIATAITAYRQRMLPEARRLAATTGYVGARFPWQSAVTGAECSPRAYTDSLYWTKEVHITPDIVLSHRLLYRLTHNDTWLSQHAWALLSDACHFLASFVTKEKASGNFTVLHVLPTTEAGFRDSPAYTTAAIALSMQFCVESAIRLNETVPANWSHIAAH